MDYAQPLGVGAGRLALASEIDNRGPTRPERVACGERVTRVEPMVRPSHRVVELGRAAPLLVRMAARKLTLDVPAGPRAGGR